MTIGLRGEDEGGVRVSYCSVRDLETGESFIEAVSNGLASVAVLSNLQQVDGRRASRLDSSHSSLQLARVCGEHTVEQVVPLPGTGTVGLPDCSTEGRGGGGIGLNCC